MLLGLAELGDGIGEGSEAGDQRDLRQCAVVGDERGGGEQPGGSAQVAARGGGARDSPVGARAARS